MAGRKAAVKKGIIPEIEVETTPKQWSDIRMGNVKMLPVFGKTITSPCAIKFIHEDGRVLRALCNHWYSGLGTTKNYTIVVLGSFK